MALSSVKTFRISKKAVADQIAIIVGRPIVINDLRSVSFANNVVSVVLAPIPSTIDKIVQTVTFTSANIATFYQSYAGQALVGTITNVISDLDDPTYYEIFAS